LANFAFHGIARLIEKRAVAMGFCARRQRKSIKYLFNRQAAMPFHIRDAHDGYDSLMDTLFPMTVYFDASCPLCREEMAVIKARDYAEEIILTDCSTAGFFDPIAQAHGISQSQMMQLIYARAANGQWLIGIDVFIAVYERVGLSSIAQFWGHPVLSKFLRKLYPWIAKYRQGLSRLGANKIYTYFINRAAKRALVQSKRCAAGQCGL
jgi:predicted DCC family thiol-disulfide oxidoreductase YuxK